MGFKIVSLSPGTRAGTAAKQLRHVRHARRARRGKRDLVSGIRSNQRIQIRPIALGVWDATNHSSVPDIGFRAEHGDAVCAQIEGWCWQGLDQLHLPPRGRRSLGN